VRAVQDWPQESAANRGNTGLERDRKHAGGCFAGPTKEQQHATALAGQARHCAYLYPGASAVEATSALAVGGPMPGIFSSFLLNSILRCQTTMCFLSGLLRAGATR
jgi:hypothetical protein